MMADQEDGPFRDTVALVAKMGVRNNNEKHRGRLELPSVGVVYSLPIIELEYNGRGVPDCLYCGNRALNLLPQLHFPGRVAYLKPELHIQH